MLHARCWCSNLSIIQVTVSESEMFCSMIEGLEKTSSLITHYALLESIFLQRATKPTDELRAALLRLYGSILEFLGESASYFGKSTIKRVFKAAFDVGSIDSLLTKISDRQKDVDRSAFLVHGDQQTTLAADTRSAVAELTAVRRKIDDLDFSTTNIHSDLKDDLRRLWDAVWDQSLPLHRVADQLSDVVDLLHEEKRRKMLDWLSVIPNGRHHQSIRQGRLFGTGTWLFEKLEFQNWAQASYSSVLWLYGIPGSGKSTLM